MPRHVRRTVLALALLLSGCATSVDPSPRSSPAAAASTPRDGPSLATESHAVSRVAAPVPSAPPVATPVPSATPATTNIGTAPSWAVTGSMHVSRDDSETTTLLANGRVLVAGGHGTDDRHDPASTSAELYDPGTGQWIETGKMISAHLSGHSATLLPSGLVLVAGGSAYPSKGFGRTPRNDAELFDPTTGTWAATGAMTVARSGHVASLLPDGRVLVVGGYGTNFRATKHAEVYDPSTGTWSRVRGLTPHSNSINALSTAAVISNGRAFVVGSMRRSRVASIQAYDPASGTWRSIADTDRPHCNSLAVGLRDGRILVLCGSVFDAQPRSGSIFDPASGSWTSTAAPPRRFRNAVTLADGRVLVTDVGAGELYDPASGTWGAAGLPSYPDSRLVGLGVTESDNTEWYEFDAVTRLQDGRVLLSNSSAALLYDPDGSSR